MDEGQELKLLREMILDAQKYATDAHAGQVRNITPLQALQEQASYYEDMMDEQDDEIEELKAMYEGIWK